MRKTRINRVQSQCQGEGSHGEPCRELRNKAFCLINSLSTPEQAQGGFGEVGQPSFHERGLSGSCEHEVFSPSNFDQNHSLSGQPLPDAGHKDHHKESNTAPSPIRLFKNAPR